MLYDLIVLFGLLRVEICCYPAAGGAVSSEVTKNESKSKSRRPVTWLPRLEMGQNVFSKSHGA